MRNIACIGNFDGVHIGHQSLIKKAVELAGEKNCESIAITFDQCKKDELTTIEHKKELLYSYGIDEVIVIEFSPAFALMTYSKFIEFFLNQFEIDTLVCGEDFRFGNRAEGTVEKLLGYEHRNFEVCVMPQVDYDGRKVSSSWLKEMRKEKNTALMNKLINRDKI